MAEKARVGHQKGLRGALATQRQPLSQKKILQAGSISHSNLIGIQPLY
jgi:hypothetical protein